MRHIGQNILVVSLLGLGVFYRSNVSWMTLSCTKGCVCVGKLMVAA